MQDESKTKAQLVNELTALRQRIAELEVSEQQYRQALQESQARYRTLTESATAGISIADRDGNLIFVNPALAKMLGYAQAELLGLNLSQLTNEHEFAIHQGLTLQREKGLAGTYETKMRRQDGGKLDVLVSASPILAQDGRFEGTLAILVDFTEHKQAEDTLRAEKDSAQRYLDVAGVIIVALGADQKVILINKKGCDVLGHSEEYIVGKNWFDNFISARVRDNIRTGFAELMAGKIKTMEYFENPILTSSGAERIVKWYNTVLRDAAGNIIGTLSSGEDVTERKRAEQALQSHLHFLETLLDTIPNPVFYKDAQGIYRGCNVAFADLILGLPKDEIVGRSLTDLPQAIPPDLADIYHRQDVALIQERGTQFYEAQVQCADGVRRDFFFNKATFDDGAGNAAGIVGVMLDITERKQAEAQISRLATLIEQATESIVITDLDGGIEYVNPFFERLTGYQAQDIIGQNPRILKSDRHNQAFYQGLWDTITAGHTWTDVMVNQRKDGSLYYEEATIFPLKNTAGEIINYAAVKREITERVQIENALLETLTRTEALYYVASSLSAIASLSDLLQTVTRIVAEALPADRVTLVLLDLETRRVTHFVKNGPGSNLVAPVSFDELMEGPSGWTLRQSPPQPVLLPQDAPDPRESSEVQRRCVEPNCGAVIVVPLQYRDHILGTMTVINRPDEPDFTQQDLHLLVAMAQQIAVAIENARLVENLEEKVAARTAEMRAEKEKSDTILCSVGDAIAMSDLERRIQYVNDAFTALTGYTAQEAVGQLADFGIVERLPELEWQALQKAIAAGETGQGEATIRRKDGRTYEAAITIAPIQDDAGRLTGYVSSHRDITRLKELERARGRFMANVSHELRTPVMNVKLYTQLLKKGQQSDKAGRYLQALEVQAKRLEDLIRDILELTELDSGQAITNWKPLSIRRIVENVVTDYQSRARAVDLTLVAVPAPPILPEVKGDHVRLTQALVELVENALIFTPAGGRVMIKIGVAKEAPGQRWVTVAVRDSGPGVPPAEQERVFDRFYRGSLAESGHVPGTGLGLSIAQEIIHAHNGQITLESQVGQGSSFIIWLPVVPADS
jgi:PAS domain S-box-containing protein